MGKLVGKTALITNGHSEIALATAKEFVNQGAEIFVTGRRDSEVAVAMKEIGRNVTGVRVDLSNLDDLDHLVAQIKREKDKLDIVFANVGAAELGASGEIVEEYDEIFKPAIKGLVFTVRKALPLIPDGGLIVVNASALANQEVTTSGVYEAAEAVVYSFVRAWTTELQARRIGVHAVPFRRFPKHDEIVEALLGLASGECESIIGTESTLDDDSSSNSLATGRSWTTDELAAAVAFLACNESGGITGTEFSVGDFAKIKAAKIVPN